MTEGGHGQEPLTPEDPLTPEEEATVARMLAEAGGPIRMPDDVVAHLDGVLADLEQEQSTGTGADVVELRARRRWPRVLLAAAAVVVGGYAVGTVATQGSLSGSDEGMSAGADSGDAREDSKQNDRSGAAESLKEEPNALSVPGATQDDGGEGAGQGADEGGSDTMVLRSIRLRSDSLETGVRRALRVLDTTPRRTTLAQDYDRRDAPCPVPDLGRRDRSLPVRYDGEPAVLVAGPERRGTVEVTVWSCAGDELAATLVRP